jgi:hypothetical protein
MRRSKSASEIIAYSKILSRCFDYVRAIKLVASTFKEQRNPELIFELIRLSILIEQYDTAYEIIEKHIDMFSGENKIDEAILLRFNIATQFGFNLNPDIKTIESHYNWVKRFKADRFDPLYVPEICTCNVECNGITKYDFALLCKCCGEQYRITINGTLLVLKYLYCPCCLSRQILSFDMIKSFLYKRHNQFLSKISFSLDREFGEFAEAILQKNSGAVIPDPIRMMGQDSLFALAQLITEEFNCD